MVSKEADQPALINKNAFQYDAYRPLQWTFLLLRTPLPSPSTHAPAMYAPLTCTQPCHARPLWTESQTPVKTQPCRNFVAGGKNPAKHYHYLSLHAVSQSVAKAFITITNWETAASSTNFCTMWLTVGFLDTVKASVANCLKTFPNITSAIQQKALSWLFLDRPQLLKGTFSER